MYEDQALILRLLRNCLVFGDFKLHSGGRSAWKFDISRAGSVQLTEAAVLLSKRVEPNTLPVGIQTGGADLVLAMSKFRNHFGIVDKDGTFHYHGTPENRNGQWVTLVDDVNTTGASLAAAEGSLRWNYGLIVLKRVVLLQRGTNPVDYYLIDSIDVEEFIKENHGSD